MGAAGRRVRLATSIGADRHTTAILQALLAGLVSPLLRASLSMLALFLVLLAAPASAEPQEPPTTGPTCILLVSGPDLLYYLCVDASDADCPVYTVRVGKEGETWTTCVA